MPSWHGVTLSCNRREGDIANMKGFPLYCMTETKLGNIVGKWKGEGETGAGKKEREQDVALVHLVDLFVVLFTWYFLNFNCF